MLLAHHLVAACSLALLLLASPVAAAAVATLTAEGSFEAGLKAGESLHLELAAGGRRRLWIEQQDLDLALTLCPAGGECRRHESPLTRIDRWPLGLPEVALRIEIELAGDGSAPGGRLRLRLESLPSEGPLVLAQASADAASRPDLPAKERLPLLRRAADAFLAAGDRGGEAWARHAAAVVAQELGSAKEALPLFAAAAERWRQAGHPLLEARARQGQAEAEVKLGNLAAARELSRQSLAAFRALGSLSGMVEAQANLGLADHLDGRLEEALAQYREALAIYRQLEDRSAEATMLANIGGIASQMGEAGQAIDLYEQALALHRAIPNPAGELTVLNNLAVLYRQMGEPDQALRLYEEVVRRARQEANEAALGRALNNQGYAYFAFGDFERAAIYFEEALELRRRQGDRRGEFATLSNLGSVELLRGHREKARDYHQRALELGRQLNDRGAAGAMANLAQDLAELGDPAALPLFAAACEAIEKGGEVRLAAEMRTREADALLRFGLAREARARAEQTLASLLRLGDTATAALAATTLGRAERQLGNTRQALAAFRTAIGLLERQRAAVDHPMLRATLLATRRLAFESFALTAAAAPAGEERSALLLEALTWLERSRARGLLDQLAGGPVKKPSEGTPAAKLFGEYREQLRRLALLARERDLMLEGKRKGDPAAVKVRFEETRARLDRLEADLRLHDARLAEPAPPAIWRASLGQGTRLLHFLLSDEKSLVFVVGATSLEVLSLPPRTRLDALARRAAEAIASPTASDEALSELGRSLLTPILPSLAGVERLWIVADGGLHYLPLAALPLPEVEPDSGNLRLVDRFEITSVPSGGVLAELLSRPALKVAGPIAVFADPVFERGEPSQRAGRERVAALTDLKALPGTRIEAERIAALAPERVRLALGFDANRQRFDQEAPRAAILHLATHGLIDTDHPELSGLSLSLFGADGSWQPDGLLRLDDLTTLNLDAELVVLSGCRTALGRELAGEGLSSLAGGLLRAGSRRVLASLWPVRDRATAELMALFYRYLLAGRPAATALRQAQRELARSAAYSDPFYWAPFVLIGDPR